LERAIEIKPDFAPALLNLGSIYAQLKNYEKAREYWQRVITLSPSSNEAAIARKNLSSLP
jgi:tetratricopeptide (TPR) repeat protein